MVAGLAIVALCSPGGVRLPERAQTPRGADGTPVARSPTVVRQPTPPYHRAQPGASARGRSSPGGGLAVVDRRGDRHDHRRSPWRDRHDADRPAEAVSGRRRTAPRRAGRRRRRAHRRRRRRPSPALVDADPGVRATALGALERLGALDDATLAAALADADRRRAPPGRDAGRRATRRSTSLPALADADADGGGDRGVGVRRARGRVRAASLDALGRAGRRARRRRSCASRPSPRSARSATTRASTRSSRRRSDKPAIRRRAVLALAPFLDPEHPRADDVGGGAGARPLTDRDWQVRQAAEDITPTPDD